MEEISYTHAVFRKGKNGLVRFALYNVSFAILQVRELCSTEENITSLLWILEFLRKPQKGYFLTSDSKFDSVRESLIEYKILVPKNGDYALDSVFSEVLRAMDLQNNLMTRAIKVVQNLPEISTSAVNPLEDSEEVINTYDRFEKLAESLTLKLDFWDESTNRYSNPNLIPKVKGKEDEIGFKDGFTLGPSNDEFLKGLPPL